MMPRPLLPDRITSIDQLFDDPDLRREIELCAEGRLSSVRLFKLAFLLGTYEPAASKFRPVRTGSPGTTPENERGPKP